MKHVLFLAYHFPPLGGAGVQRNTKVARYLPELGYRLTVITGPGSPDHRWAPFDETMSAEVSRDVDVHRLPGPEPSWTGSRVQRWLRLTRVWQRWWEEHAIPLALDVGRDADVVYASVSPYSTAGAAATIAQKLGRPLVFDLEDPWALDEMLVHETGLHARLERRTMGRALDAADAVVMNTPEAAAKVRAAFPRLARKHVTSIVNGYDASDFDGPAPAREPGAFRIVHTGSLHTDLGRGRGPLRRALGGSIPGVNVLTRSLVYLKQALQELLREHPELEIELHIAGRLTDGDRAALADCPALHEHGFLSHGATIELIRSADLLFLPMHDMPEGRRVTIVPCKTYEYLGSRRPILAAVPPGDARDYLEESRLARICEPDDVAGMKREILAAIAAQDSPPEPSEQLLARLERRQLMRELVELLQSVDEAAAGAPSTRLPAYAMT